MNFSDDINKLQNAIKIEQAIQENLLADELNTHFIVSHGRGNQLTFVIIKMSPCLQISKYINMAEERIEKMKQV